MRKGWLVVQCGCRMKNGVQCRNDEKEECFVSFFACVFFLLLLFLLSLSIYLLLFGYSHRFGVSSSSFMTTSTRLEQFADSRVLVYLYTSPNSFTFSSTPTLQLSPSLPPSLPPPLPPSQHPSNSLPKLLPHI